MSAGENNTNVNGPGAAGRVILLMQSSTYRATAFMEAAARLGVEVVPVAHAVSSVVETIVLALVLWRRVARRR